MKKNFGNNNRSSDRSDKRHARPDSERSNSRNDSGRSSDRNRDRPDRPVGRFSDSKKPDSQRSSERSNFSAGSDQTEKRAYTPEGRSGERDKGRERGTRNHTRDTFSARPTRSDDRRDNTRSERKPFNTERSGERKPFNSDNGGERRSFNSARTGERKPFNTERSTERKPFNAERSGEKKSFGNERFEDRKRFSDDREKRSFSRTNDRDDRRSDGGSERKGSFNRDEKRNDSLSAEKRLSRFNPPEKDGTTFQRSRSSEGQRGDDRGERGNGNSEERGERRSFGDAPERKRSFSGERSDSVRSSRFSTDRSQKRDPKVNSRFDDQADAKKPARTRTSSEEKYTPSYDLKRYKDKEAGSKGGNDKKVQDSNSEEGVRLNRYIANAGVCSRRDADLLIESGEIKVNGKVVKEMGYRVNRGDVVKYGNRVLNREKLVYVLLNKPKDFITTTNDPDERKTVMDLVANACDQRIYPVGRLDRNTTGLLLLTNDGEIAEKLAHPSNEIKKVYQVELDRPITESDLEQIKQGVTLEDGPVKVDDVAILSPTGMVLGVELHSGRNRIVRRIFEHLNYEVVKLDRTVYAGLNKKDLPRGNWRFLTEKEVIKLRYFS